MRMCSKRSLQGLLALAIAAPVAGGLFWLGSQPETHVAVPQWLSKAMPAAWRNTPVPATLDSNFGQTALHFEPNVGQAPEGVHFLARGSGYALLLTANEAVFHLSRPVSDTTGNVAAGSDMPQLERAVLRAQLVDANPAPAVVGQDKQASYSNYFIGNNPRHWHTGVAHYSRVHYGSVWPGIDLVYYGNQQQLEYDFLVAPGVDPDRIRLRYQGAQQLRVDSEGGLIADTAVGPVRQMPPLVYQQNWSGGRDVIAAHYTVRGNEVGFVLGDYDRSRPLVIDPVLVYSSYLGGGSNNNFNLTGIAVTPGGAAYVTGYTDSASFPTQSPYQSARQADINSVITRFANDGQSLIWSTYLGGSTYAAGGTSRNGRAAAIAVDAEGNAWVAGQTFANNFPIPDGVTPLQSTGNVLGAGFLTKIARDGQSLLYSTYLSGNSGAVGDGITSLAVAADNTVWLSGSAGSSNFPVSANALQPVRLSSTSTGFVSHLAADGQSLSYSSYLGGSGVDTPARLVLAAGDVFIAGRTTSADFPVTVPGTLGGTSDAFVSRLSGDGQTLKASRYLGGSADDVAYGLAVDSSGNAFVAGATRSTNFPVQNALADEGSKASAAEDTAFLTRINNDGSVGFSTFLGNSGTAYAVALTRTGEPVVAGQMTSAFKLEDPVKKGADVVAPSDSSNGFIRRLSADGQTLRLSTVLGGNNSNEAISALALDDADAVYVAGYTQSTDFPTQDPAKTNSGLPRSGFVSKLGYGPAFELTVYPSTIGINMDAILSWNAPDADSCVWDDEGDQGKNGTRTENKTSTGHYDYTLRCTNANGTRAQTVTLEVIPAPIPTLSLSPGKVAVAQEVTLSWSTLHATRCGLKATKPDGVDADTEPDVLYDLGLGSINPAGGSLPFTPKNGEEGNVTFTLSCEGRGAVDLRSDSKTLTIVSAPALTLTGTPARSPLFKGDQIVFNWNALHVQSCAASGMHTGSVALNGSLSLQTTAAGTQGLTLTCPNDTGQEASKTVNFTVYDDSSKPAITLSASANTIKLYEETRLSWSASNAATCQASGAWSGGRAISGTNFSVKPTTTGAATYTLTCSRPTAGGGVETQTVNTTVNVTQPDPPTLSFVANGSSAGTTVAKGEAITLSWSSTRADSCTASGWTPWNGPQAVSGSRVLTSSSVGQLELTLSCQSGDPDLDPVEKTITVTVTEKAPTPASGETEDSGGPVDLLLLGSLGLLGLARRKTR